MKKIMSIAVSNHHDISLVEINHQYFIKKELLNESFNKNKIDQLMLEGDILKALDSHDYAKCYETFVSDKRAFIILELIRGETLFYHLKTRTFSLQETLNISLKIMQAISVLHNMNIIHNDINPMNIMLEKNNVKLIDFSVATEYGDVKLGSPEFSSPEQIIGTTCSFKTDVWGIGCVLYYMIVGRRPFKYKTQGFEQLDKVIKFEDFPKVTPIEIKKLIMEMISYEKSARPSLEKCQEIITSCLKSNILS